VSVCLQPAVHCVSNLVMDLCVDIVRMEHKNLWRVKF
jgi:hypothetical protein